MKDIEWKAGATDQFFPGINRQRVFENFCIYHQFQLKDFPEKNEKEITTIILKQMIPLFPDLDSALKRGGDVFNVKICFMQLSKGSEFWFLKATISIEI